MAVWGTSSLKKVHKRPLLSAAAVTPDQITQQNSLQRAEGSKPVKGKDVLPYSEYKEEMSVKYKTFETKIQSMQYSKN
jgi:hypothetical protein